MKLGSAYQPPFSSSPPLIAEPLNYESVYLRPSSNAQIVVMVSPCAQRLHFKNCNDGFTEPKQPPPPKKIIYIHKGGKNVPLTNKRGGDFMRCEGRIEDRRGETWTDGVGDLGWVRGADGNLLQSSERLEQKI